MHPPQPKCTKTTLALVHMQIIWGNTNGVTEEVPAHRLLNIDTRFQQRVPEAKMDGHASANRARGS